MKKEKVLKQKKDDFGALLGRLSWIRRIISRQMAGRKKDAARRKLLSLGSHLLKDLGLDSEGRLQCPVNQLPKKETEKI